MVLDVIHGHDLPLLFEKRQANSTEIDLAAYCDPHDLIATVHTPTQDVVVYRINGQVAFTIKPLTPDNEVSAVKWKPDGSLLGIGWIDGTCGVYSGENGKLLSQTSVISKRDGQEDWKLDLTPDVEVQDEEAEESPIPTCIGWTSYGASKPTDSSRAKGEPGSTEEWFDSATDDPEGDNRQDLAKGKSDISELVDSITTLDVAKVLPRLSAIPSHGVRHGPEGSKFSTQASTDSIFDTCRATSGLVDTLVTSGTSGYSHVLLDESVEIGSFNLQKRSLMHAAHPQCLSQVILSDAGHDTAFRLHYIDLPLDTLAGPLLHVIATNTKRLQSLVDYISQAVRCIQHDFTTGLQFPSRLINNIGEELSEKQEGDVVTQLYSLAMTGSFTSTMLEWLTDVVKENNHKRWDQAVNTMYTNIQNHISINLLPALDRLSISASALRGQARLHEGTTKFDVSPEVFTALMDDADASSLVAHKMQLIIMTEHRQFRAFSKWMRVMIEVGVAGPGTKGAIETEEREIPNLDYSLLLAYIKNTLTRSELTLHIEQRLEGSCSREEFFEHPMIAQTGRQHTIEALQKSEKSQDDVALNLPTSMARLAGQTRVAIESITKWQSKMLSTPTTHPLITPLSVEPGATILNLRMYPHDETVDNITEILATSPPHRLSNELHLYRVTRLAESKKYDQAQADFEILSGEIRHGTILDQNRCILLLKQDDQTLLLSCDLEAHVQGKKSITVLQTFMSTFGFTPDKFIVGGRKRKMVCIVFGVQGKEWKIFDLDGGSTPESDDLDDEMAL